MIGHMLSQQKYSPSTIILMEAINLKAFLSMVSSQRLRLSMSRHTHSPLGKVKMLQTSLEKNIGEDTIRNTGIDFTVSGKSCTVCIEALLRIGFILQVKVFSRNLT